MVASPFVKALHSAWNSSAGRVPSEAQGNAAHKPRFKRIDSPVGLLKLVANDASLAAILWENDSARRVGLGPLVEILATPGLSAERQLAEYLPGERKFFDVPLASPAHCSRPRSGRPS